MGTSLERSARTPPPPPSRPSPSLAARPGTGGRSARPGHRGGRSRAGGKRDAWLNPQKIRGFRPTGGWTLEGLASAHPHRALQRAAGLARPGAPGAGRGRPRRIRLAGGPLRRRNPRATAGVEPGAGKVAVDKSPAQHGIIWNRWLCSRRVIQYEASPAAAPGGLFGEVAVGEGLHEGHNRFLLLDGQTQVAQLGRCSCFRHFRLGPHLHRVPRVVEVDDLFQGLEVAVMAERLHKASWWGAGPRCAGWEPCACPTRPPIRQQGNRRS